VINAVALGLNALLASAYPQIPDDRHNNSPHVAQKL